MEVESLNQLVGSVGLKGVDSSYAYVVGPDGIMLYHPTESKIGQPVENAVGSLSVSISETMTAMGQVEKAVSEIADGAGAQANETQRATENVIFIGDMVKDTTAEVENLLVNATSMKTSGDEASATLLQLEQINRQTKEAIDTIYEQTNESAVRIRSASWAK